MRAVWLIERGNQCDDRADPEGARRHWLEAWTLASSAGEHRWAALAASNLGLGLLGRDDLPGARRWLGNAQRAAEAGGDRRFEALALGTLAEVERVEGALDRAEALASEALEIWSEIGEPRGAAEDWRTLAHVAQARGDPSALGWMRQARDRFERHGNQLQARVCDSMLAEMTDAPDGVFDALGSEMAALGGPRELGANRVRHAAVALRRGDRAVAERCLEEARARLASSGLGPASELGREIAALAARLG